MRVFSTGCSVILVTAALVLSIPAQAEPLCGKRSEFVKKLQENFGETLNSAGLATAGNLFEIYRSKRGSWTILVTERDGATCVVATGKSWTERDQSNDQLGQVKPL